MSLMWIKSQPTFLSKDVQDLLLKAVHEVEVSPATTNDWLSSDYEINWGNVENTLSGISELYDSKDWFKKVAEEVAPLFSQCDKAMSSISSEDYITHLQPNLKWTHQEEVVATCVKLLHQESSETDHLLALLMITSLAERALGNLLLTRRKQVPFLLRDLLITSELQEILGKPKIQLLVVLLGSVLGLNLRNIAWHGFLRPEEGKSAFVATIIFILVDCGRDIKNIPELEDCIPKRPQTSFSEAECLSCVFMDLPKPSRSAMEDIIRKSPLVPDVMMPVWHKVLDLLDEERYGLCIILLLPMIECSMRCLFAHVNGVSTRVLTAENSSFYTTLDEILQLDIEKGDSDTYSNGFMKYVEDRSETLSKSLTVNAIDHDFVHGKINETQKAVCDTSLNTNLVPLFIGRQINEALHDVLNFVHGPRVRDKLSHGEVQLDHIPKDVVYHILYISLLLLSLGNWRSETEINIEGSSLLHINNESATRKEVATGCSSYHLHPSHGYGKALEKIWIAESCDYLHILHSIKTTGLLKSTQSVIKTIEKRIRDYKCVYHPSAILHRNLYSCVMKLENWTEWNRVCCTDLDYASWETADLIDLPEIVSYSPHNGCVHKVLGLGEINIFKTLIEGAHYNVLYRPKSELELISILSRIVCNIQLALENMQDNLALKYFQYTNKTLRSRQRETYRRQLIAVPTIILNCYFTSQIIYMLFKSIDILQLDRSNFSSLLKSLKKVLKLHENFVSQTSANVNRWEEALKNSIDNINDIKKVYGK